MLRFFSMFFVIIINFILQSTLFQYITIAGIKPNTAILIIVCYAILRGDVEGAIAGFFAGLLQDMFFGYNLGLFALLGALTGFVCGKPFKDFFRENYLLPVVLTVLSMLAYELMFYVTSFLLAGRTEFSYYFNRVILPETIYTTLLSLLMYRIIYGINRRLEAHEKKHKSLFSKI